MDLERTLEIRVGIVIQQDEHSPSVVGINDTSTGVNHELRSFTSFIFRFGTNVEGTHQGHFAGRRAHKFQWGQQ